MHVTVLGFNTTIRGTYPKLEISLVLARNLSSIQFPAEYGLVMSLSADNDYADQATMVTTITLHVGMCYYHGDHYYSTC